MEAGVEESPSGASYIAPPRDLSPLKIQAAWERMERDVADLKAADAERRPDFAAIQAARVR
jgi:hypothetical protein